MHLSAAQTRQWERARPTAVYKNPEKDRFIVDRRGVNGSEGKMLGGPTSRIPQGSKIAEMFVARFREGVRVCSTDRRDMYYQVRVSTERAETHVLGPPVSSCRLPESEFRPELAALRRRGGSFT